MFHWATVTTSFTPSEVTERLRRQTIPAHGFLWNWRHIFTWDGRRPPEFAGRIGEDRFKLQYLSPFMGVSARPIVSGTIVPTETGTQIHVTLRALAGETAICLMLLATFIREMVEGSRFAVLAASPILFIFVGRWVLGCRKVLRVIRTVVGA